MSYDPNQPQPPDSGQQPQQPPNGQPGQPQQPPYEQQRGQQPQQPPYGQPQPPYGQPGQPQQPPYGQLQPPYGQPGQPQQPPYEQQWGQQPPQGYAPTQYIAPAYGAQPVPGYMPPQQPRRSRRGLWIALGIIGGVLVLSCAVCGILFATGAGFLGGIIGKVAGPTYTVSQYYNAVERQDYATAFTYMVSDTTTFRGQPINQQSYTIAAQGLDILPGKVSNYSVGNISLNNNNNTTSVTVVVTRANAPSYTVLLQLQQVNGSWKIISIDNI